MSNKKLRLNQGEKELLAKLQEPVLLVETAKLHLAVRAHRRQSKRQRQTLN
jgi:hypothetical protein